MKLDKSVAILLALVAVTLASSSSSSSSNEHQVKEEETPREDVTALTGQLVKLNLGPSTRKEGEGDVMSIISSYVDTDENPGGGSNVSSVVRGYNWADSSSSSSPRDPGEGVDVVEHESNGESGDEEEVTESTQESQSDTGSIDGGRTSENGGSDLEGDNDAEGEGEYDEEGRVERGEYGDGEYGGGEDEDNEYGDGEYDDEYGGEYGGGEYGGGEYGEGEYGDGEYGEGEYGNGGYDGGEYGNGEYEDGEHEDGEYGDGEGRTTSSEGGSSGSGETGSSEGNGASGTNDNVIESSTLGGNGDGNDTPGDPLMTSGQIITLVTDGYVRSSSSDDAGAEGRLNDMEISQLRDLLKLVNQGTQEDEPEQGNDGGFNYGSGSSNNSPPTEEKGEKVKRKDSEGKRRRNLKRRQTIAEATDSDDTSEEGGGDSFEDDQFDEYHNTPTTTTTTTRDTQNRGPSNNGEKGGNGGNHDFAGGNSGDFTKEFNLARSGGGGFTSVSKRGAGPGQQRADPLTISFQIDVGEERGEKGGSNKGGVTHGEDKTWSNLYEQEEEQHVLKYERKSTGSSNFSPKQETTGGRGNFEGDQHDEEGGSILRQRNVPPPSHGETKNNPLYNQNRSDKNNTEEEGEGEEDESDFVSVEVSNSFCRRFTKCCSLGCCGGDSSSSSGSESDGAGVGGWIDPPPTAASHRIGGEDYEGERGPEGRDEETKGSRNVVKTTSLRPRRSRKSNCCRNMMVGGTITLAIGSGAYCFIDPEGAGQIMERVSNLNAQDLEAVKEVCIQYGGEVINQTTTAIGDGWTYVSEVAEPYVNQAAEVVVPYVNQAAETIESYALWTTQRIHNMSESLRGDNNTH